MKKRNKFYITTAIDYVNNVPHIGTAYEKIGADVLARFHRLMGDDVLLQMGNDEHSINVFKAAKAQGLDPQTYCTMMRKKFEDVWKRLDISYDNFIQTSSPIHKAGLQKICDMILDRGDIYKSKYEGWYCESCEAFYTDKDLEAGLCPNHKSKPKWLSEENYFFALSKYQDRLIEHIEKNKDFILPSSRRNEILNLIKSGLQDISISRASAEWGVEFSKDPAQKVYVWVDALTNYITGIGFGNDEAAFKKWWPADLHLIGKDITRFHCVIWPALLMSAKVELPKTIFGHGFIHLKGEKMSKTLGNIVDPLDICERFGSDALRYYLLRHGSFGSDGDFTFEHFSERYNAELANGIGNLVSRLLGMIEKYQQGTVHPLISKECEEKELYDSASKIKGVTENFLDHRKGDIEFHNALLAIQEAVTACDKTINEKKPWEMAKANKSDELSKLLTNLTEAVRIITIHLIPFIPSTSRKIWSLFDFDKIKKYDELTWDDVCWGMLNKEIRTGPLEGLFPRIENKKGEEKTSMTDLISITDFSKIDLRVAQVMEAEKIEGADKLLKLKVSLGEETRQIVAGIAQHYAPDDLVGKSVVVVSNLQPAKLKGVESHGMLLAATDDEGLSIVTTLTKIKAGTKVK